MTRWQGGNAREIGTVSLYHFFAVTLCHFPLRAYTFLSKWAPYLFKVILNFISFHTVRADMTGKTNVTGKGEEVYGVAVHFSLLKNLCTGGLPSEVLWISNGNGHSIAHKLLSFNSISRIKVRWSIQKAKWYFYYATDLYLENGISKMHFTCRCAIIFLHIAAEWRSAVLTVNVNVNCLCVYVQRCALPLVMKAIQHWIDSCFDCRFSKEQLTQVAG